MLRTFLALSFIFTAWSVSADEAEKSKKAAISAVSIITQFAGTNDNRKLASADATIEKTWQDYARYFPLEGSVGQQLALIRARSASSAKDKKRVAEAWDTALKLQPTSLSDNLRLAFTIQAAHATANVGDYSAARRYFAAAQTYAFAQDRDTKALQLNLKINELRALGPQMEWRRLRDNLTDMRIFSQGFSLWTVERLDALVSEAELRLALQPESDDKRRDLGELKSKIELTMKNTSNMLTAPFVNRVRNFYYAIEDYYDL